MCKRIEVDARNLSGKTAKAVIFEDKNTGFPEKNYFDENDTDDGFKKHITNMCNNKTSVFDLNNKITSDYRNMCGMYIVKTAGNMLVILEK